MPLATMSAKPFKARGGWGHPSWKGPHLSFEKELSGRVFQHSSNVIISSSKIFKQSFKECNKRKRVLGEMHAGTHTPQILSSKHKLEGFYLLSEGKLERFNLKLGRAHGFSMG